MDFSVDDFSFFSRHLSRCHFTPKSWFVTHGTRTILMSKKQCSRWTFSCHIVTSFGAFISISPKSFLFHLHFQRKFWIEAKQKRIYFLVCGSHQHILCENLGHHFILSFFFYFIVGQSQWRKCHNDSVADFVRIFCYFFGGQKYRKSKRTNERLHLNVDTSYDNHLIYHSNRLVSFDLQLKPIAHAFFATSKTIRHLKRQNERNLCRSFEHMAASWKCRQKTIQWTVFSVQRANLLANILN